MKANRLISLGLFAALSLGLTTGCPGLNINSTTPEESPAVAPADIVGLNGKLLFDGAAANENIIMNIKKLNGSAYEELSGITATTVKGGYYQFARTDAGTFKVVYKQGSNVNFTEGNNTVGYLNSKDIALTAGEKKKVDDIDLCWDAKPGQLNKTVAEGTVNFTFLPKKGTYEYQIHVNGANVDSNWVTPSAADATVSVPVTLSVAQQESYTYVIKYRGSSDASSENGGTPIIPFTVTAN